MKNMISILFLLLVVTSCSEKMNDEVRNLDILTVQIDPHKDKVSNSFGSFFKKTDVINLETTDASLIGRVDKLVFYKDFIYILDKKLKKIFIFNKKGKYQRTLNHFGHGEGEYTSLVDFQIKDDKIYLLDQYGSKLFIYDLNDQLIKVEKVRKSKSIAILENGYAYNMGLGFADNNLKRNYYSYCYEDDNHNILGNRYNENLLGYTYSLGEGHNSFYKRDASFYTLFPFNDTIYTVAKNGMLNPYQVFKIGNLSIKEDDEPKEIKRILDNGISRSIFAYYDFSNYSFFSYYYGDESRKYVLVDKSGKIIFNTALNVDVDKIPIRIISCDMDTASNFIVSLLYPFELLAYYERNKDNDELKKILDGVKEDNNPILVVYSLN